MAGENTTTSVLGTVTGVYMVPDPPQNPWRTYGPHDTCTPPPLSLDDMRRLIREELARLFPEASAEALLREGGKPAACDHADRSDDGTGTMRCDSCGSIRAELTPYKKVPK